MEVRKICQWCGKPFIAQKTTTCYCSHQCSNLGYKERIRERKRQLKRSQELLQPRQAAEGQDFFSFAQAAKLMGVTRQYIYKLVKESKLRASRISGKKSLIRRADIELMMKTKPYERIMPKEDFDITDYYTAEEIADKYKVNAKWVWTYTRQHKVPKVRIRQFNYYSKKHIDAAFAKYEVDSDLTEWYTPEEIQEKYGMTRVAIRSQVYRNNIPSKKEHGQIYYSKLHFDLSKSSEQESKTEYYTVKEAMEKFNLSRDSVYGILQFHQIADKLITTIKICIMHECKTVTLRTRPLKNRMLSFYLDYYPGYRDKETMKVIRHESLGIYVYANPRNKREQSFNEVMTEKAEAIRCRRFESVVNERYDFFDRYKLKADFLEYYRKQLRKHDQKWEFVYLHFRNFVHGKCTFEEIDIDLCNKFREYLLSAKKLRRNGPITRNSASGYWSTFRGFLKILYRNGMIKTNVNDFLDKIETEDVVKEYLSVEELYKLAETPCKKPILKIASLFSCMTSLRISDILALCWEDIVDYSAGGKCVHIITQKNKAEDIIPISEEALGLIGYSSEKKGLVFKGLMRSWTQAPMKEWIRSAGITKNITFHSYRRTFATLQAAAGTDIRTIQSIMAHKSITTTQRYIKVVDANKREASKKITLTRKD